MRGFKFRAWDKVNELMSEVTSLIYNNMNQQLTILHFGYLFCDVVLMQYTGLKDKNGVEIYEGDILKYPYVRSSSVNYTIEIGVIEWSDEYCGFIIDEVQNIGGFCGIESKHMNEIEVIGNIYENPELFQEGL